MKSTYVLCIALFTALPLQTFKFVCNWKINVNIIKMCLKFIGYFLKHPCKTMQKTAKNCPNFHSDRRHSTRLM